MEELIEFAEERIKESSEQNESIAVIQYWVGYMDGLRAAQRKINQVGDKRW